jgi:hypothetical protein
LAAGSNERRDGGIAPQFHRKGQSLDLHDRATRRPVQNFWRCWIRSATTNGKRSTNTPSVPCPRCHAAAGQPCRGTMCGNHHGARVAASARPRAVPSSRASCGSPARRFGLDCSTRVDIGASNLYDMWS